MIITKGLLLIVFISALLLASICIHKGNIPTVKASVQQGDLVISGNTVYTIEGRFDINGSIIVKENATLILKDAFVNFTQSHNYQYNMTFQDPLNGHPRLLVENATIFSNNYYLYINLLRTSTATINKLSTSTKVWIFTYEYSSALVSNSAVGPTNPSGSSTFAACNSTFDSITGTSLSSIMLQNCTIGYMVALSALEATATNCTINDYLFVQSFSANFSVAELKPCFVEDWSFELNCSVAVAAGGSVSNVTLHDTWVGGWSFDARGNSNATISHGELVRLSAAESANVFAYNSVISQTLNGAYSSKLHIYNTTIDAIYSSSNSIIWLINSTYNMYYIFHQSMIHVNWYLDVHVIDSSGNDVPSANVTATYPNATLAGFRSTNGNGWARLTLMEKMMNATGEYLIGNYNVEATYETYSNSTELTMTGNQIITLKLEGFVIPEFSSLLVLPLFMIATLLGVFVYKRKHSKKLGY